VEGLALFLLDHGQVHASTRSAHGALDVAGELLDHGQVHASTRSAHGAREVAGELLLQLVPLVDRVLVQ
jgi:hypothetical protein